MITPKINTHKKNNTKRDTHIYTIQVIPPPNEHELIERVSYYF